MIQITKHFLKPWWSNQLQKLTEKMNDSIEFLGKLTASNTSFSGIKPEHNSNF